MAAASEPRAVPDVVADVHATPSMAVLYTTGGGAAAFPAILGVPGASATVLEASIPYARDALVDILGAEPEQYVCEQTAIDMARAAYRRASALSPLGTAIVGIGATAGIVSTAIKRGDHRFHIAACTGSEVCKITVRMHKAASLDAPDARSRVQEDLVVSNAIVWALARACGVDVGDGEAGLRGLAGLDRPNDTVCIELEGGMADQDPVERLLKGEVQCVEFANGEVIVDAPKPRKVYLSGSFNPLHDGHRGMLKAAAEVDKEGRQPCFEMSVWNADKGTVPKEEVTRRVQQFIDAGLPLMLTREPLFSGKVAVLRESAFVVGYDTAARLVMPKYYGNSLEGLLRAFDGLRNARASFIVAGRVENQGEEQTFKTLNSVDIPAELEDLFVEIPEDSFRMDISSTELREKAAKKKLLAAAAREFFTRQG